MTLPVILLRKMTSLQAITQYFPSGNPKLQCDLGGRVLTLPYKLVSGFRHGHPLQDLNNDIPEAQAVYGSFRYQGDFF